jgi:ATP phosphoribosyltransferase
MKNRIRIAIQKSGRLSDESLRLLVSCGISTRLRKEQLFYHSDNFPVDLLLVRDDDIPQLVADGVCDFGIVGTNLLQEMSVFDTYSDTMRYLAFAFCRLSLAVPNDFLYQDLHSLETRRIATSYPHLLKRFLDKEKIAATIITLSGSVEIAPRLGIADAICDLVSTGATLETNNLGEVQTIFKSQAVLIRTPKPFCPEKARISDCFLNRVQGNELANGSKYIMLHAPKSALKEIITLLPGVERPTILELQGDTHKVAVHALCSENVFWETMEELKKVGASSILVLPVEKMMM